MHTRRASVAILGIAVGCLIELHLKGSLTVQQRTLGKGRVVTANLQIHWDAGYTRSIDPRSNGQMLELRVTLFMGMIRIGPTSPESGSGLKPISDLSSCLAPPV